MRVIITADAIELDPDGGRVGYYPYYIDQHWNEQAEERLVVMQKIVAQWADELTRAKDGQKLYLPYSLNDQDVECFEAQVHGNDVKLRCVEVNWNGYSMALGDLNDFITHPHELWSARAELFATYPKQDFIDALSSAELCDEPPN
jgi:hypothetical protein